MPSNNSNDFFDRYPRFMSSSVTDTRGVRMAMRHKVLIEENAHIIAGKRVLDLASHDGRWSFAALEAGARHVCGIEAKQDLIEKAQKNFSAYQVSPKHFQFLHGDCLTLLRQIPTGSIDTIFCFGFLYHTLSHFELLKECARIGAKHLILDTLLMNNQEASIRLAYDDPTQEGAAVTCHPSQERVLVGIPSRHGIELMLENLGFTFQYRDWHQLAEQDWFGIEDYYKGRRFTLVAKQQNVQTPKAQLDNRSLLHNIPALQINEERISLAAVLEHTKTRQNTDFLDNIIDHTLVEQAANQQGIHVSPEEIERLKQQLFPDRNAFSDLNEHQINTQLEGALRFGKLRGKIASQKIEQAYVELNNQLEQVSLSRIICDNQSTKNKIEQALNNGDDFASLAETHSLEEETACGGGFMGKRPLDELDSQLVADLENAENKQILGPYAVGSHWHFYRLEKRWPAQLDAPTRTQLYESIFNHWLQQTRSQASIKNLLWEHLS